MSPSNPASPVRLGAVGYLNARPLVYGLDASPRFSIRYDLPSECARLLHDSAIDVGLIPSIEYLRGGPYRIVPDLAIASSGPVASVALYAARAMADVRSIAVDTSSRTSIALVSVLCRCWFRIQPTFEPHGPDLTDMLAHCDAALIIGDKALFPDESMLQRQMVEKIDLGEAWSRMTALPFVYAFWAGRPDALQREDVEALTKARDEGVGRPDELARSYLADSPERQKAGADYLRDNIRYYLRDEERAGLDLFYRYAAEAGVVPFAQALKFF